MDTLNPSWASDSEGVSEQVLVIFCLFAYDDGEKKKKLLKSCFVLADSVLIRNSAMMTSRIVRA